MISFVWPPGEPMVAGAGGSETYTAGHVRELLRRGIPAQVVTIGHGTRDGRKDFPDIPFLALENALQLQELGGQVVFVNRAYDIPTKTKAAIILHCVVPKPSVKHLYKQHIRGKTVIATSIYNAQQWALYLDIPYRHIHIVLPFADPIFGNTPRSKSSKYTRVLYAGRLHPEKGIYTLLEMMHEQAMRKNGYKFSIVMAGQHVETGKSIARMLQGYPYAELLPPQKTIQDMAELLGRSDVLVVPSVYAEPFGMLSIEAQHAGCRVVASNMGGLPETNCGLLTLVEPRNPRALLRGIDQAAVLGAATKRQRAAASSYFSLDASVDALLAVLRR
ncbi:glycosyltransferase family 4 protein [Candidatus Saccharibacteria bacterium]|nr:MAG: glycosyltransferase family 4 protein [Candidatus Saccharibacteria bacterium]